MNKRFNVVLMIFFILVFVEITNAAIYKCPDSNGVVHFSSIPCEKRYIPDPIKAITFQYQYDLSVLDVDGNPLDGVKIEYTLKENGKVLKRSVHTTTIDGLLREKWKTTATKNSQSKFSFNVSKEGYYTQNGSLSSSFIYEKQNSCKKVVKKDTKTLIRPIDYLNKSFASTISDIRLKTKILNFIDLIISQRFVNESVLETHSVNLAPFKNNNYLQFKFINVNVYNSLRLDKYDIGKRLFDEVIRKVLTSLDKYIAESKLFYGYDLLVVGYTKNFAGGSPIAKAIEYRFITPKNVVRQYKNKDISGQQVLDASVILMDDERIELKLQ